MNINIYVFIAIIHYVHFIEGKISIVAIKKGKQWRLPTPADILINIYSLIQSIPMTELGIKCSLVYLQVSIVSLLISLIKLKIPDFSFYLLFTFNNIIMTNEPAHTASKGRMTPGMPLN